MEKQHGVPKPNPTVLKSASLMSLGTLSSRILGLVRDQVLVALFPRLVTDTFVVAFRLPNLFRRILGEGSLAASFVPVFVEQLNTDREEAARLASSVMSLLWVVTGTLSVLGIIFMDQIIGLVVSGAGYQSVAGKQELTVFLARIMFSYLFLVTTYAFLMSVSNSFKRFFWPAVAPAFFNAVEIIFSFFPQFSRLGDQLAWGVIAGGVVQIFIVAYSLRGIGLRLRWSANWKTPGMKVFLSGVIPSAIGMGVGQILGLLNVYFASRLPEGAHSYIYLADRLLEFPQSLIAVSLGVALLPTLSELWAIKNHGKMIEVHQEHMRILMAMSLPAAMGLYVLAEPIISVIFGHGAFSAVDVQATAAVTRIYAAVLLITGLHRVILPGFYAIKNTWLPAAVTVVTIIIHFFVADHLTDQYGLPGLVGATAVTGFLNLLAICLAYQKFVGPFGLWKLLASVAHLAPSVLVMGWVVWRSHNVLLPLTGSVLSLALSVILGVFTVSTLAVISKHPEANRILSRFTRRWAK